MALLPRIKTRLTLHAHRRVTGLLDGEYAAAQVGRSAEFNDLREYVRGDEVKDIDWKASARTRSLLVKRFEAARKHTLLVVVSTGRSMAADLEVGFSKREAAVFAAGVLGLAAAHHGDQVALAVGDAASQRLVPPGSGELHLERCLQALDSAIALDGAVADLAGLLGFVGASLRRRTLLVLVCDEDELGDAEVAGLRRLMVQHEVLVLLVDDVDPTRLPRGTVVADVDHGTTLPAWALADRRLADEHAAALADRRRTVARQLDRLGVVHQRLSDEAGALPDVHRLLERHRHVGRR